MILFATAGVIGYRSLYAIFLSQGQTGSAPGILALLVACFTIGFKEILYRYSRTMAERINSVSLRAEAWHHRTDALASVGTLVGIAGSMLGFAILDSVGSGIISLFIFKAACDILRESFDKMIDRACEPEEVRMMENIVGSVIGVKRVDSVKTRIFGSKVMVDVEFEADAGMSVQECYEIAQAVDRRLHGSFGQIKTCTVQVRPYS